MVLSLAAIVLVGGIGYIWASRGFFSAFLQMVVVIASGAIAFGLWETVAYLMLDKLSDQWMIDAAWGASLALPFVISVALLSLAVNSTLRWNIKCDNLTNWIGGGVCGAVIGTISSGIIVLSFGMLRGPADQLSYTPIETDAGGSLVRTGSLLFPVDRLVASAYGFASETTLRTSTPLAAYRPQFADEGHLLRNGPDDMLLKYSIKPADAQLMARYTVAPKGTKPAELIGDAKPYKTVDGESPAALSYLEGYIVKFKAGAREKNGQVIVGPGSVTLVMRLADDSGSIAIQPVAMISQAKGESLQMGRWRFDGKGVFLASAGASSDPIMAFEFLVPVVQPAYQPLALYVKGIRYDLQSDTDPPTILKEAEVFDTPADRMAAVSGSGLLDLANKAPAVAMKDGSAFNTKSGDAFTSPIRQTHEIKFTLDRGNLRGLEVDEKTRQVTNGEATFDITKDVLPRGSDKGLRVEYFAPGDETLIVRVEVSPESSPGNANPLSILGPESESASGPPQLIDTLGQKYDCIGYVYSDRAVFTIRFLPGSPIRDKNQLRLPSRSRDDQKLALIFRVSKGVSIKQYAIGDQIIKELQPPIKMDAEQTAR